MKIIEIRYVPIPYAYKLLSESQAVREEQVYRSDIVPRTVSYLREFSKCFADDAIKAVKRLMEEVGLSEFASVMVVNIRPRSIAELKAILAAARVGTTLSDEELKKVLEILNEVCRPLK